MFKFFRKRANLARETENFIKFKHTFVLFCVRKNLVKRVIRESFRPTLLCSKMGIHKNGSSLVLLTHTWFKNGFPFLNRYCNWTQIFGVLGEVGEPIVSSAISDRVRQEE